MKNMFEDYKRDLENLAAIKKDVRNTHIEADHLLKQIACDTQLTADQRVELVIIYEKIDKLFD